MKIFISVIVSIVLGLILGYIPSKIALAFDLGFLGFIISMVNGAIAGTVARRFTEWTYKYWLGILCAVIISFLAFYNYHYHLYLPIKRNPPQDAAPEILALKKFKEPQGFFSHLAFTAFDDVTVYSRRRGETQMPKFLILGIEGLVSLWVAITSHTDRSEN